MGNHINFYDFMELWHWKNKPLLVMDKLYLNDEFDTVLMELSDHHVDTLENIKQYDIEFEFAIFPEFSPLRCSVYTAEVHESGSSRRVCRSRLCNSLS